MNTSIPHIRRVNGKEVLFVKDQPFILLAGEVHNSDSSSPAYMEHIWDIGRDLGMNTLLLPVTWEMTEPEEGMFDFSVPMALIDQAREREMHIVFLWFGSWKNAECMYAPAWVKQDLTRFPRAQIEKGKNKAGRTISPTIPVKMPYTTLSYLGEETARCDARAFATFMGFLKDYDETEQTVIAVQVENETGLLGAARDHSDAADALFESPVPADFAAYMRKIAEGAQPKGDSNDVPKEAIQPAGGSMVPSIQQAVLKGATEGTWSEVFSDASEEIFSAYYTARFVETVAKAGKEVYPLPMAANCWLDKGGEPGMYPTGGPVSKVHEVWNFCAPSIDVYCPDIYVPQFKEVCDEYTRRGKALFIPESATHSYCAPRLVYTVGHFHAMCYSPFGFDDIGHPFTAQQGFLFGMDVTDPALKTPQSFEEYGTLGKALKSMMPMLAEAYGSDRLQAVSCETDPVTPSPTGNPFMAIPPTMSFGSFRVSATFQSPLNPRKDGVLLCLKVADDECYLVGNACSISFSSADPAKPNLDFLLVEEGSFENGEWKPGRRFNGDETASMSMGKPSVWRIKFFTYL